MNNVVKRTEQVGNTVYTYTDRYFTQRMIGKCKVCKKGHVASVDMHYTRTERSDVFRPISSHTRNLTPYPEVQCCGKRVSFQDIKGHKNDHKCDARCLNSKGPNCECSCGGANHGKGWE